jgi:apolipoprotein N-acyltransferase
MVGSKSRLVLKFGLKKLKPLPKTLGRLLLVLLAGAGMGLANAPASFWVLAWVALAPLWVLVWQQPPLGQQKGQRRRAFGLGLAWGFGYHGFSLFWLTGLHPLTWMGLSWGTSLVIATSCWLFVSSWGALLVGFWALGVAGFTGYRHGQRSSTPPIWQRLLVGVALWCGLEWLWSRSFLWWTSLSLTQSPNNLAILHLGHLSGPAAVVAALVLVNGLAAVAWNQGQTNRLQTGKNQGWLLPTVLAVTLLSGLHLLGWGLAQLTPPDTTDNALKVGIIQGNVPTRIKLYSQGLEQAMQGYTRGYEQVAKQGVQAVLTPEAALPFLFLNSATPHSEATRQQTPFLQAVHKQRIPVWIGSFVQTGDVTTQSLLTLNGEGEVLSRYNKVKLVPLGEYIPLRESLGRLVQRLSPVQSSLTPGAENQRFGTPFGPAIVGICFDSAFSHLFQQQAAAGGELILTAANNDPYSSGMMLQHHAQDVLRAIETDRWAARATNTGYSGVVNPHGQTIWRSGVKTYEAHTDTLYRRQTRTLYVRLGDWLTPTLVLGALALSVRAGARRTKQS